MQGCAAADNGQQRRPRRRSDCSIRSVRAGMRSQEAHGSHGLCNVLHVALQPLLQRCSALRSIPLCVPREARPARVRACLLHHVMGETEGEVGNVAAHLMSPSLQPAAPAMNCSSLSWVSSLSANTVQLAVSGGSVLGLQDESFCGELSI